MCHLVHIKLDQRARVPSFPRIYIHSPSNLGGVPCMTASRIAHVACLLCTPHVVINGTHQRLAHQRCKTLSWWHKYLRVLWLRAWAQTKNIHTFTQSDSSRYDGTCARFFIVVARMSWVASTTHQENKVAQTELTFGMHIQIYAAAAATRANAIIFNIITITRRAYVMVDQHIHKHTH